jgi:hypothetical protein
MTLDDEAQTLQQRGGPRAVGGAVPGRIVARRLHQLGQKGHLLLVIGRNEVADELAVGITHVPSSIRSSKRKAAMRAISARARANSVSVSLAIRSAKDSRIAFVSWPLTAGVEAGKLGGGAVVQARPRLLAPRLCRDFAGDGCRAGEIRVGADELELPLPPCLLYPPHHRIEQRVSAGERRRRPSRLGDPGRVLEDLAQGGDEGLAVHRRQLGQGHLGWGRHAGTGG